MKKHALALGYLFLCVFCVFVTTQTHDGEFRYWLLQAASFAGLMGFGLLFFAIADNVRAAWKPALVAWNWIRQFVPAATNTGSRRSNSEDRLVEVYRAKDSPQAHTLKWALEEEGILTWIDGDQFAGALGELTGWASAPRIMVREKDVTRARTLVELWEREEVPEPFDA